ncbi:MAG: hypothetical protein MK212_07475 [Saprospiraceae bacterium]|uniref:hypothetical protein n=1 Tax=Kordia sp. TaxID=1965332 RepID=UPI0025BA224A|nr:hypothetical protein [Kordia sp.]MCH2043970.1 hypothetical protein [Saprospiraceae bacterium]MCH2196824.1 hypothetical protein [Kordia sp.]
MNDHENYLRKASNDKQKYFVGEYVKVRIEFKKINRWLFCYFACILPVLLFAIKAVLDVEDPSFNASRVLCGVFAIAAFVSVYSVSLASTEGKLYTKYTRVVECRIIGVFDKIAVDYNSKVYQVDEKDISKI